MSGRTAACAIRMGAPNPACKLVLILIGEGACDDGVCWPDIPWMAKAACMSEDEVADRIAELALFGAIWVGQCWHPAGVLSDAVFLLSGNEKQPPGTYLRGAQPPSFGQAKPKLDVGPGRWRRLRSKVFARDNYACVYCGSAADLVCDHVVPRRNGGLSTMENLATACWPCNSSKGARSLADWKRAA